MIKFWRTDDPYGEFSNFYFAPFELDGKQWKTSEHYYQAQKTTNPVKQEEIRNAETPKEAKNIAMKAKLAPDWDNTLKYRAMRRAVLAKFSQNNKLKELLLSTGQEELAEDSPYDFIWGLGDGTGTNWLGHVLEEVREILRIMEQNPSWKSTSL